MDPFGDGGSRLVILSYNCQNLFDDVDQGTEYSEYDPSSGTWNNETYLGKLAALAEAIRKAPREPDILLLQEVENRGTLERLARDFLPLGGYDFYAAPKTRGAAAQTGIISRVPVENVLVHRPGGNDTERNILEVSIQYGEERIVLLNNHWKSRLGGAEATEPERIRSALLIRRRIEELRETHTGLNIILAGDFNEDPWEEGREYPAALGPGDEAGFPPVLSVSQNPPEESAATEARLYSFWSEKENGGSYFYGGAWERIDHFFWNRELADGSGWDVAECILIDDPLLLNAYGTPLAYSAKTMTGYSDHLPLLIVLEER
jgi:endonuclease/exonuclease/phosphatase family metal-dependent hydrolase